MGLIKVTKIKGDYHDEGRQMIGRRNPYEMMWREMG